jgi:dienelactone hydrolase
VAPPESPLALPGRADYAGFQYTADGITHAVYWKGAGPGVVVLHELPGLAEATLALCDRIVDAGFFVAVPHLFGSPLKESKPRSTYNYVRLCISSEFARLKANVSAPITTWLRALTRDVAVWCDHPKVGAIGMCLTGGFVIPMMLERGVSVAVTSQPAIPLTPRKASTNHSRRALNVASADVAESAKRATQDGKVLLGFRFSDDWKCPAERFSRLKESFGDQFHRHDIPTPDPRWGLTRNAHSVLTYECPPDASASHPSEEAIRLVIAFLARLKTP